MSEDRREMLMANSLPRSAIDLSNPMANLATAWEVATILSQSDLVPSSLYGKPANTLLVMMMGQELDLTPAQAVRLIYSPSRGQTGLAVELMLARLRAAGHDYEYDYGPDKNSCTFTLIRSSGRKYSETFDVEDAKAAGLVREKEGKLIARSPNGNPMPWELWRRDMLFARAASRAVKHGAPEVTLGFGVTGTFDSDPEPVVTLAPSAPAQPPGAGGAEGPPPPGAVGEGPPVAPPSAAPHREQLVEDLAAAQAELTQIEAEMGAKQDSMAIHPSTGRYAEEEDVIAGLRETVVAMREEDDWALLPVVPTADKKAGRAQQVQLADRFAKLGWDMNDYRLDVLRACSLFCQRRITSAADLSAKEAAALAVELARIERQFTEDAQPVALAEQVEVWRTEALRGGGE